jgi:FMN-dependent oxidoreductase (nitrilotriacetate monooxygenase family)
MKRKMHLIGYIAVPTCHFTGMWRHPLSTTAMLDRSLYESVARTLEEGLFDMVFMPDSIALGDTYGGDFRATVEFGSQSAFQPDPVVTLMAMASVTRHLGLGATMSTSYVAPFNIARMMGTLDLLSGGRAAWNIVTSSGMAQARNFGADRVLPTVDRYDRADEVVEVVTGLWSSWDRDAVVIDKDRPLFIDPAKVRYLDHDGPHLKVRGPLSLPRSPQGHPVLMQAGASERGLAFGTRWGEFIFAIQHSPEDMKALRT